MLLRRHPEGREVVRLTEFHGRKAMVRKATHGRHAVVREGVLAVMPRHGRHIMRHVTAVVPGHIMGHTAVVPRHTRHRIMRAVVPRHRRLRIMRTVVPRHWGAAVFHPRSRGHTVLAVLRVAGRVIIIVIAIMVFSAKGVLFVRVMIIVIIIIVMMLSVVFSTERHVLVIIIIIVVEGHRRSTHRMGERVIIMVEGHRRSTHHRGMGERAFEMHHRRVRATEWHHMRRTAHGWTTHHRRKRHKMRSVPRAFRGVIVVVRVGRTVTVSVAIATHLVKELEQH
jgi:hypothetical protein